MHCFLSLLFATCRKTHIYWNRELICSVRLLPDKGLVDSTPYLNSMDSVSLITKGKPFCYIWKGERSDER